MIHCSSSPPGWTRPGFSGEKKFSAKILCIFRWKHLGFHPQTSILQSKPKKLHKKRIKGRIKISPNFLNPIKWAPKTIKKKRKKKGFCSKRYFLQVSNINRAWKARINTKRKKKCPKNGFQTKKRENPNMQLKCHPCML